MVTGSAMGAKGSSRVVIRGTSSLTGNNQPLYVVDGITINNNNLGAAGVWGGTDFGDGISSINPDEVQSVSVLKGGAAAARCMVLEHLMVLSSLLQKMVLDLKV